MTKAREAARDLRKLASETFDLAGDAVLRSMLAIVRLRQTASRVSATLEHIARPPEPVVEPSELAPVLSKREEEVLQALARGLSTKEAARELGIAFKTAASHRASIMEKLDVHETASMIREAIRRGLVRP